MNAPPERGRSIVPQLLLAGIAIALVVALLVTKVFHDEAERIVEPLGSVDRETKQQLTKPQPDGPQTILLAGLDHRYADGPNAKSRSDTMLLVRLDPEADATAVLSLPRDLRVKALGKKGQQKLNTAWFTGGSSRLVRIVSRRVLGSPDDPFEINGVVAVQFDAFAKVVNGLGCLYAEVDRKYFIAPNSGHAQIDQPAGYQLLCGQDALAYVRFRVQDSDFLREARQQNYLTEVRTQIDPVGVLRGSLLRRIGRNVRTNIKTSRQLLALGKLLIYMVDKPTARIELDDLRDAGDGTGDVLTSEASLQRARERFLGPRVARQKSEQPDRQATTNPELVGKGKRLSGADPPTLVADLAGLKGSARIVRKTTRAVPVLGPDVRAARGTYQDAMTRGYRILDRRKKPKWPSYKVVVGLGDAGQYYGVEGTTWKDPPILQLATDRIRLGGRTWDVQYDGRRIRRLIWRAPQGTYWVTNTLTNQLTSKEMYALAHSFRRVR